MFKPKWYGTPPLPLRIRSDNAKADGCSPNTGTVNLQFAEMQVLAEAHTTGKWAEIAANSGLSMLCDAPNLALKPPGIDIWHIALGDVGMIAGLGWPCISVMKGGALISLAPDYDGRCKWLLVNWRGGRHALISWATLCMPCEQSQGRSPSTGSSSAVLQGHL